MAKVFFNYPVPMAIIFIPLTMFIWIQLMAIGLPYRYAIAPPGLRIKKCWQCDAETSDYLHCSTCGAFRLGRVLTAAVWILSLVVTVAWITNDTLMMLVTLAGAAKGGRR